MGNAGRVKRGNGGIEWDPGDTLFLDLTLELICILLQYLYCLLDIVLRTMGIYIGRLCVVDSRIKYLARIDYEIVGLHGGR